MVLVTDSKTVISLTWLVTIVSAVASFLIIGFVIWFRGYIEQINQRRQKVDEIWEDALYTVVGFEDESFAELPAEDLLAENEEAEKRKFLEVQAAEKELRETEFIKPNEVPHFLFTWNYLHESLKGNAAERLNVFAEKFEIKNKALKLLKSRLLKNRLLAINTLGNLEAKDTYGEVLEFALKRDPVISVWAYRAMFRIRPIKTSTDYLHLIVLRKDWSPAHVAKILSDCGADLVSKKLTEIATEYYEWNLEEKQLARLISYLRFAYEKDYEPLIEKILDESDKMEALIAAMRLLKSTDSLPKVRKLLTSKNWQLRMYAVRTLGRFGERQDIKLLVRSLGDLDWWVRYHSARALFEMPIISHEKLTELSEKLPNEFQRDILRQVLAEEEFKCRNQTSSGLSR